MLSTLREDFQALINEHKFSMDISGHGNIFIYKEKTNGEFPSKSELEAIFSKHKIRVDIMVWCPPNGALIKLL